MTNVQVELYSLSSQYSLEVVGQLNQYTSLLYTRKYSSFGEFQVSLPLSPENLELLDKSNVLWIRDRQWAGLIEKIESSKDIEGNLTCNISGRSLEALLTLRIIWGSYSAQNKAASDVIHEVVRQQCIQPTDQKRKLPLLTDKPPDKSVGKQLSIQKTGYEVYNLVEYVAVENDLGFRVDFDPEKSLLTFETYQGIDRTQDNGENKEVIFDTLLEDILDSSYRKDNKSEKNVAFVHGEEPEGQPRKYAIAGKETSSGFDRKELYVDARDLQSDTYNLQENAVAVDLQTYVSMLIQRGEAILAENRAEELYEAKIRIDPNSQYQYGIDYSMGDIVTIIDRDLGVQLSARVVQIEEGWDESGRSFYVTFGFSRPSVLRKLNLLSF